MASRTVEYKRRKRARLFEQQGGRCFYCQCQMTLERGGPDGRCPPHLATIEHLTPKACGGTLSDENTVAACWQCNNDRGDGGLNHARKIEPQARIVWQDA